jgi:hypothetical protein
MTNLNPGGEKAALYLEDLRVGQRFRSGTHRMDADQVRAFAEQFDPQPFHLDAEAAKATLFEELYRNRSECVHGGGIEVEPAVLTGLFAFSPGPSRPSSPSRRTARPRRCGQFWTGSTTRRRLPTLIASAGSRKMPFRGARWTR